MPILERHAWIATLLLACGCNTAVPRPPLMANMAKDDVSVHRLRAIDYEYAARFGQLVAVCAEQIVVQTDDPSARSRALYWRMWASPQARSAAFDQDPLAGFVELWVLAAQQREYFTQGLGRNYFSAKHLCVDETTRHLEREAERIAAEVVSERALEAMTARVHEWVAEHPIEGQLDVRPTARADLASFFPTQPKGGLQAVGSMEQTLNDLNDRLTILTVQVPVETRWQVEFLVNALFEEQVGGRLDTVFETADGIKDLFRGLQSTVTEQTAMLLSGVELERLAIFDAIETERKTVLEAIEHERTSILDWLDTELEDATAELDAVGRGLIDHFFKRLIQVLVGMGVFVLLTVALVLLLVRKRSDGKD